jgi:hypothetical protein
MIVCPFCQAKHVANTLFCCNCGTCLFEKDSKETSPFDVADTDPVDEPGPEPGFTSAAGHGRDPLALRVSIGPSKRAMEIPLTKAIYMGRLDPASTALPEIDLSAEDREGHCISRHHARIRKHEDTVFIEDLGSTNGTYINGRRLTSYIPETMKDYNVVQLGRLLIEVEILREQVH